MQFNCGQLQYVGMANVRNYDENDCIVVRRLFTFLYNNSLYGTRDFKTVFEFTNYVNSNCVPCGVVDECCSITYNGCYVTYNGGVIAVKR